MKTKIKTTLLVVLSVLFFSCNSRDSRGDAQTKGEHIVVHTTEDFLSEALNTISTDYTLHPRFRDWEERDWFNNDFLRFLRSHFDAVYSGMTRDNSLEQYRSLLNSRFVIVGVAPPMMPAEILTIDFIFIDTPNKIFRASVVGNANVGDIMTVPYLLMDGIRLVYINTGLTREDILEFVQLNPMFRLW